MEVTALKIEQFISAVAELGFSCKTNEPMCRHTTFAIGGPADVYVEITDVSKINEVLKFAVSFDVPYTVIGNGSNLLISDKGVAGAVLKICDDTIVVKGNAILSYKSIRNSGRFSFEINVNS